MSNATTPLDLGARSTLLLDKHADFIKSYSKIWEVSTGPGCCAGSTHAQQHTACWPIMSCFMLQCTVSSVQRLSGGDTVVSTHIVDNACHCHTATPDAPQPWKRQEAASTSERATMHTLFVTYAQTTDRLEHVATEHFWMSGMYWGLTAMHLMGRLHEVDGDAIVRWILTCQHEDGGFGGSARNDSHLLYTLSAVQVLALYDRLGEVDADKIATCEWDGVAGVGSVFEHVGVCGTRSHQTRLLGVLQRSPCRHLSLCSVRALAMKATSQACVRSTAVQPCVTEGY